MNQLSSVFKLLIVVTLFMSAQSQAKEYPVIQGVISKNDFKQASSLIKKALQETPKDSELHYLMAQVHLNNEKLDKAEDSIEKAIKLNQTSEDIWLLASGIYGSQAQASSIFSKLGYAKKAKKSLGKVLSINPNNSNALAGLIQFHLAAPGIAGGDKDAIPGLLSKLAIAKPTMGVILKSQLLFSDEKLKEGYQVLDVGIKNNPNSIGIRFMKGMRLQNDKRFQESFDELNKASEISLAEKPGTQEKEWHQMALYQSAKNSAEAGVELEQGKKNMYAFMELEQTTVSEAWIRFRLGQILWQLDEKDFAKAQFELITTLNPDKRLKTLKKEYFKKINLK